MGGAVTTGAGVLRGVLVNAACQAGRLVSVATGALHVFGMIRMWISRDGGVAGGAFQASMHTGVEGAGIYANAMPVGVLRGHIAVTGEAVGLRVRRETSGSCEEEGQDGEGSP